MKPHFALPIVLLLAGALFCGPAAAQGTIVYRFELSFPTSIELPVGGGGASLYVQGNFTDRTNPFPAVPPGAGAVPVLSHSVTYSILPRPAVQGWTTQLETPSDTIHPGETKPFTVRVIVTPDVVSPFYYFDIFADVTVEDGSHFQYNVSVNAFYPGISRFEVQGAANLQVTPREIATATFYVTNRYQYPHAFNVEVASNPCGFGIVVPQQVVVGGLETRRAFQYDLVTPADQLWYLFGETCQIALAVSDAERPDSALRITVTAQITGFSGDLPFFFNTALFILILLLLIVFVRRRKERIEERILGKPQKPWLIPVEKVYLAALKRKDPRAWYVVRHHLMEDEYRSSLLWFKSYKAATKGDRKKERLILVEERKYDKWKAKWRKAIAKPMRLADRYEAKLQRKLDRKARRSLRKANRRWKREARKLKKAHAKAVERAGERHEKAVKKAARKGMPEPALQHVPEPQPSAQPTLKPLALAEHRWAKRAARYRNRMERRQGNLEVRFEKADARYLARLRGRVQRIARKLDDPTFVAEHPMLQGASEGRPAKASPRT